MKVVPAILEQEFGLIETKVQAARGYGLGEVQIDVADGMFVPNKTYNNLEMLKKLDIGIEAHLMVKDPLEQLRRWKKIDNVTKVIVHFEALNTNDITEIIKSGKKISIAINPDTPLQNIYELMSYCLVEHVLFMGVTPGFSGQEFQRKIIEKIKLFNRIMKCGITTAVDGGVNEKSAPLIRDAGIGWLNGSSFIWNRDGSINSQNFQWLAGL
jgi:ribulose-phosphate 3-epimerase